MRGMTKTDREHAYMNASEKNECVDGWSVVPVNEPPNSSPPQRPPTEQYSLVNLGQNVTGGNYSQAKK